MNICRYLEQTYYISLIKKAYRQSKYKQFPSLGLNILSRVLFYDHERLQYHKIKNLNEHSKLFKY